MLALFDGRRSLATMPPKKQQQKKSAAAAPLLSAIMDAPLAKQPKLAEEDAAVTVADPLKLAPLFASGGEPWLPLLQKVIEAQPEAGK